MMVHDNSCKKIDKLGTEVIVKNVSVNILASSTGTDVFNRNTASGKILKGGYL